MRNKLGARGEALAVTYLTNKHYRIIAQNWHCQRGEIDIIAQDAATWVFCEVKTRRSVSTQQALVNITEQKRQKMILAAQHYLHEHELDDVSWRIDAIAIAIQADKPPVIDHVEDVLDW
ncbi:MAG: YraN family protein [Phototrophicaceae bacterium]